MLFCCLSFLHPLLHHFLHTLRCLKMHINKCAPTHFLSQTHTQANRHNRRGENQANHPHEFLLKWDYWNGSPCFSMSIIAHYASGDKNIYFPSGSRSNYSCSLLRPQWSNSGSWTNLVNNMLGCLSGFNMRCQLGLAGVWRVSQTDKTSYYFQIPSAPDRICISPKMHSLISVYIYMSTLCPLVYS